LHNKDFVGGLKAMRKIKAWQAIYEDADVTADLILFVHHPEADTGIAAIEIGEKRSQSRALRFDEGLVGI